MKKIAALFMSAVLALSITGCSTKEDWEYIEDKGTFVVGITLFEPMNYKDENGELTGFETEFTKAVCEKLGVEPVFQVIDWNSKEMELESKAIDAIWNGLTVTEDRKENMAFSTPYIKNRQIVIIRAEDADVYATLDSLAGATVAAEGGSAGQTTIEKNEVLSKNEFVKVEAQSDVLLEVKTSASDIGVIDYVMASASVGEGTSYSELMISDIEVAKEEDMEEYAIGLRLGDTETLAKVNEAIEALVEDGTLKALAEKYNLLDVYILG